jgi:hypothetical protein
VIPASAQAEVKIGLVAPTQCGLRSAGASTPWAARWGRTAPPRCMRTAEFREKYPHRTDARPPGRPSAPRRDRERHPGPQVRHGPQPPAVGQVTGPRRGGPVPRRGTSRRSCGRQPRRPQRWGSGGLIPRGGELAGPRPAVRCPDATSPAPGSSSLIGCSPFCGRSGTTTPSGSSTARGTRAAPTSRSCATWHDWRADDTGVPTRRVRSTSNRTGARTAASLRRACAAARPPGRLGR